MSGNGIPARGLIRFVEDAEKFARSCSFMCRQHGHRDQCPQIEGCSHGQQVWVAQINASSLKPDVINLKFKEGIMSLPVLTGCDGVIFLRVRDARHMLRVDSNALSHKSEWFALHGIPPSMISRECWLWNPNGQGSVVIKRAMTS